MFIKGVCSETCKGCKSENCIDRILSTVEDKVNFNMLVSIKDEKKECANEQ